MTTRLCMWSGPRNLSTAMMRSFESRADCVVIDEPFFAPFLAVSGKAHPGRQETLTNHETDPERVADLCLARPQHGEAIYFQKHMPHHMLDGFPLEWMSQAQHFFLIRHPARVIASYAKGRANFTLNDLGYPQLSQFYKRIGAKAPILDCDDILKNPEGVLRALCAQLKIPFDKAMLCWAKGPRGSDGAWAPYWYTSVENSSGFGVPPKQHPKIKPEHTTLYTKAKHVYDQMFALRLLP